MAFDFSKYFEQYEAVVAEVDNLFGYFSKEFPDRVRCDKGCCDCCYALFDLSLVEALYLNHHFGKLFSGLERTKVLENSDAADRQIFKLKRKLFKAAQSGVEASEVMEEVARARVRCPLLGEDDLCMLYDKRPLTCRLYGVPTAIAGKGHTCQKSGFVAGEKYPTVHMDALHDRLLGISQELADDLKSSYKKIGDMLMPVSTALMNEFDEEFMGIRTGKPKQMPEGVQADTPMFSAHVTREAEEGQAEACSSCTQDKSMCQSCSENSFSVVLGGPDKEEK